MLLSPLVKIFTSPVELQQKENNNIMKLIVVAI